jgi:hypothetical protein
MQPAVKRLAKYPAGLSLLYIFVARMVEQTTTE